MEVSVNLFLELVPLRNEYKKINPHPQSRNLVPLKGYLQIFNKHPHSFYMGVPEVVHISYAVIPVGQPVSLHLLFIV